MTEMVRCTICKAKRPFDDEDYCVICEQDLMEFPRPLREG